MADYTQLDAAIVAWIATRSPWCHSIAEACETAAKRVAKPDIFGKKRPRAVVERRLQSLRKRGLIAYSPKRGWSVTQPNTGA